MSICFFSVYPKDELQSQVREEEKSVITDYFSKKLSVSSLIKNNLPELPSGYAVQYFRRSRRTQYDFDPNLLVVSEEEEMIVRTDTDSVKKRENLVRQFAFIFVEQK